MIELPVEIKTFLLAMAPMGGLIFAIPVALTVYGLSSLSAYLISVAGNLTSSFLILIFLGVVSGWLSKHSYYFNRFFAFLFSKTRKKHSARVMKYGLYALTAFVAVPLPMSGAWTASLIAFVFDIPIKKAFPAIAVGVMMAGGIVLFASNAGLTIRDYLGWQVLAGIVFAAGIGYFLYRRFVNGTKNRTDRWRQEY